MSRTDKKPPLEAVPSMEDAPLEEMGSLQILVRSKNPSREVFVGAILEEVAIECDSLKAVRKELGVSPLATQISSRRVQSLKLLADLYMEKNKNSSKLDPKSQEMQLVLKSVINRFKEALEAMDNVPPGFIKQTFQKFSEKMEDWEADIQEQLEALYTGSAGGALSGAAEEGD